MVVKIDDGFVLSQVSGQDVPELLLYLNIEEIHLMLASIPNPYTRDMAQWWVANVESIKRESGKLNQWAIRDSGGKLIGGIGFVNPWKKGAFKNGFGYWIAPAFQGKGIMTKIVRKFAVEVAFGEFELTRLQAQVYFNNKASARVLEKSGFTREGILRSYIHKGEEYKDVYMFSLLKNEI